MISAFKRFLCWIGWHGSLRYLYHDGCSVHARCGWCDKQGKIDSQGNFF